MNFEKPFCLTHFNKFSILNSSIQSQTQNLGNLNANHCCGPISSSWYTQCWNGEAPRVNKKFVFDSVIDFNFN